MVISTGDFPAGPSVADPPQMADKPPAMAKAPRPQYPRRNAGYDTHADSHPTPEQESESDLDEIFRVVVSPKTRDPLPPKKLPINEQLWISKGRAQILNRQEGLEVPVAKASEKVLRRLEEAEKTEGGPKDVLTELMIVGYRTYLQEVAKLFQEDEDSDSHEDSDSPGDDEVSYDIIECARRVMVAEARVQEWSTAGHTTNGAPAAPKETTAIRTREPSVTPPGGHLIVNGPPDEDIPPRSALHADIYSNRLYWQYAPYLDTVCLVS